LNKLLKKHLYFRPYVKKKNITDQQQWGEKKNVREPMSLIPRAVDLKKITARMCRKKGPKTRETTLGVVRGGARPSKGHKADLYKEGMTVRKERITNFPSGQQRSHPSCFAKLKKNLPTEKGDNEKIVELGRGARD